ncbi:MAG: hypothetical protein J0L83_12365 [Chitinophagales bacterium]|jgi:uncharacterized membrane protein YidH (DUF202 family)|nr:hypothetical protein [Chitinophagales bacterium]
MNLFEAVLYHDYYVLRDQHRLDKAGSAGAQMIFLAWVFNAISVLSLWFVYLKYTVNPYDLEDTWTWLQSNVVLIRAGSILVLCSLYMVAYLIYGGKQKMAYVAKKYTHLNEDDKKSLSKKGANYFYGSMFLAIISVIVAYGIYIL